MISDKIALHYEVISNIAHKIEKVSKQLSSIYKDSYFDEKKADIRKKHLKRYLRELNELLTN